MSNLIGDLTKWSNHVEAQLKVLQADKQELSEGAVAEIQQVANNLVTDYLENVKITFQNTRNWRKQMGSWIKDEGEKFFDSQMDGWDVIGRDDVDELGDKLEKEIEDRKEQSTAAEDVFTVIADRLDALGERLDREGCQCGDRKPRSKRRIEE